MRASERDARYDARGQIVSCFIFSSLMLTPPFCFCASPPPLYLDADIYFIILAFSILF